jgi:hypothetical protein
LTTPTGHGILFLVRNKQEKGKATIVKVKTFGDKIVVEVSGGDSQEILDWVKAQPGWKTYEPGNEIWLLDVMTVDTIIRAAIESGYVVSLPLQGDGQTPTGDNARPWVDDLVFQLLAEKIARDAGEYVRDGGDDEVVEVEYHASDAKAWIMGWEAHYLEMTGFDPKVTGWRKDFFEYLGGLPKMVESFVVQSAI